MKLNGFSDEGFGFCHGGAGGNAPRQIGNIRRVVCRGLLDHAPLSVPSGHVGTQTANKRGHFFPGRLVRPDFYGSRLEWIHMNHPSTGLRNESPACLLTF